MNFLQKWFAKMTTKRQIQQPLGRWTIDTCDKKTNIKIDSSNEDHCGPCGKNPIFIPSTKLVVVPIPEKITLYKKDVSNGHGL